MNRYPLWKYVVIAVALVVGFLYTLPNLFPEVPAVQVSSSKAAIKIDTALLGTVENGIEGAATSVHRYASSTRSASRCASTDVDTQIKAKDVLQATARRQLHRRAQPDLDVAALARRDRRAADVPRPRPARRRALPAAGRHEGRARQGGRPLHDGHPLAAAREEGAVRRHRPRGPERRHALARRRRAHHGAQRDRDARSPTSQLRERGQAGGELRLVASLKPEAQTKIQDGAVQQNIQILRNRVNELGVAEPIIQQQGAERVVVQLPGVQDTARAKDILGRTATLEIRMVNEDAGALSAALGGTGTVRQRPVPATAAGSRCSSGARSC